MATMPVITKIVPTAVPIPPYIADYISLTKFFDDARANSTKEQPTAVPPTLAPSLNTTKTTMKETEQYQYAYAANPCSCNCSCVSHCFCNTILCSSSSSKSFDPGKQSSRPMPGSFGSRQSNVRDANYDHLFKGISLEPPYIPTLYRSYYASTINSLIALDPTVEAIDLLHQLHNASGHLSSYALLIKQFRLGFFNDIPLVKNHQHIESIRPILHRMSHNRFQCSMCFLDKLKKRKIPPAPSSTDLLGDPYEKGSVDFYGPIGVEGVGGYYYILFYITERGRIGHIRLQKKKATSEIVAAIQAWRLQASSNGWTMEKILFDADPSFLAKDLLDQLRAMGIDPTHAAGGQHFRIGLVERFIATIAANAHTMLDASGLPAKWWTHAFAYAVFLYNSKINNHLKDDPKYSGYTPFQVLMKSKYFHLKQATFGQLCFASPHDKAALKGTKFLQQASYKCCFMGYEFTSDWSHPVAVLLNLHTGCMLRSNDFVLFRNRYGYNLKQIYSESSFGNTEMSTVPPVLSSQPARPTAVPIVASIVSSPTYDVQSTTVTSSQSFTSMIYPDTVLQACLLACVDSESMNPRTHRLRSATVANVITTSRYFPKDHIYSRRLRLDEQQLIATLHPDEQLFKNEALLNASVPSQKIVSGKLIDIPKNWNHSQLPKFNGRFDACTKLEMDNIIKNKVFGPWQTTLPMNAHLIGLRMDYNIKIDKNGDWEKDKGRMIAQGYNMEHLVHYHDTYCPTPMKESFRTLVYYATAMAWHTYIFDIKFAFLNADMDPLNTWVECPQWHPAYDPAMIQYAQMLKALYGTKQAALLWFDKMVAILLALKYTQSIADPCSFNLFDSSGAVVAKMIIHIDDMPWVAIDKKEFQRVSNYFRLTMKLEVTESSDWSKILGVLIGKDKDGHTVLFNDVFIIHLIQSLNLSDIPEYDLPAVPNLYFSPNIDSLAAPELHKRYRTLIGSFIWINLQWRSDIGAITGHLSRFVSNPSIEHWNAALRVLGYLKKYPRLGFRFTRPHSPRTHVPYILVRTDANWAGDTDCISVSSIYISLHTLEEITIGLKTGNFPTFNLILASSKRQQSHVADSSDSSETYCVVSGAKINAWLRISQEDAAAKNLFPTPFLCDNQATVINAQDGRITANNRDNCRKLAYLKEQRRRGNLTMVKIPTATNISNQGTKPEGLVEFTRNRDLALSEAI